MHNKYCIISTVANTNNKEPPSHECFKNWEDSSQAMEADIIVEGLKEVEKNGLMITRIIAHGDSSTYAAIKEKLPWGWDVKKIKCANHACKCLRSNLEKLVDANPHYKWANRLSKPTRVRLTTAVRCAIRMRAQQADKASWMEGKSLTGVHGVRGMLDVTDQHFALIWVQIGRRLSGRR